MKCFHLIIIFKFLEEEYLEVKNMNFKKKKSNMLPNCFPERVH